VLDAIDTMECFIALGTTIAFMILAAVLGYLLGGKSRDDEKEEDDRH
jgi:hypothetical protein